MDTKRTINVKYRNSSLYRNVHVNGGVGGLIPTGDIYLGLYSERGHIPESSVVVIQPDGMGLETLKMEAGTVREMEVGLMMSLANAISVRDWLTEKIEYAKTVIPEAGNVTIRGTK